MTALEKQVKAITDNLYSWDDACKIRALLSAHAKCKWELALIRKLARMSGVDKHWWKVGGVTL